MPLNDDLVCAALDAIVKTRAHELSCDEFLEVMGQLAELQQQGVAIPSELTHALEHLAGCSGCQEELEAVRAALFG